VLIDSIDHAGSYEFSIDALFKDIETGGLYYGRDSGCSCPTPFENTTSLSSMEKIATKPALANLLKQVRSHYKSEYSYSSEPELKQFIQKAKDAFDQYNVEQEQKRIDSIPKHVAPLSDVTRKVKKRNIL
jgi:peptidase E